MKVLGLVGSPRVGGNTELLVAKVLEGASSAGAEVEQIALNKLDIRGCQGCEACRKLKHCRIKDDMQPLYDKMLEADAVVLGTPIYYWNLSAQLKAFVDRWYALDQEGIREGLAGKQVLMVCAFGDTDASTSQWAVGGMRASCEWLDMPFCDPLLVSAGQRGEVAQNAEAMAQAYQAGAGLVG